MYDLDQILRLKLLGCSRSQIFCPMSCQFGETKIVDMDVVLEAKYPE